MAQELDANEFKSFLHQLGYKDFVVQMCISVSPMRGAFCFAIFEDLNDANKLRNELLEVSAQF